MLQQTQLLHFIRIPECLLGLSFLVGGSRLPFLVLHDISLSVLENSPPEKSGLLKSSFSSGVFCHFVGHCRYCKNLKMDKRQENSKAA